MADPKPKPLDIRGADLDDRIREALTAHHVAIIGKTGMGKSWVGKLLVEYELRLKHRVAIVDPTGVWWGLKASADGQSAGFPVAVLGGEHADRPLRPDQGAEIARILAGINMPAVLDVSDWTKGDQHRFVLAFAEAIYDANRGSALRLVLDEADEWAPQGSMPEERRMFGAVDRIVRRGRSRGLYVTLITQRPAVLHKNVLSQADALVALGVTAPQDRKALLAWVEGNTDTKEAAKEFTDSLPRLPRGEGWAWAPKADVFKIVHWPAIATFDSGRTPKHGEVIMPPATLADIDLSALDAVAGEAADTPAAEASVVYRTDPAVLEKARAEGYRQGHRIGHSEGRAMGVAEAEAIMAKALAAIVEAKAIAAGSVERRRAPVEPASAAEAPVATEAKVERRIATPSGDLPAAARKLLSELAARHPAPFTWAQIAMLAGLKARGGHFNEGRKALRDRGFIVEDGDSIAVTEAGLAAAGVQPSAPRSPAEVVDDWCAKLPGPAPAMLRLLVTASRPLDKQEIGDRLGLKPVGGHFNGGIAYLRRAGLIIENGGRIGALPELRSAP